jgi:hypothetical protein
MKPKKIVPYPLFDSDSPLLSDHANELDVFLNKPFWNWDKQKHDLDFLIDRNCCFNHIIGLPVKNDKEYEIFDYEKLLFDAIENNQNIWVLKSRGIGFTTFMIRYLAWKILSSNELDDKSIFIISGTREEHANYIKEKLQEMFENKFPSIQLESKFTELWLKRTWIKVFPTKNIKDIRGYFEASYIWVDESDHMDPSIQDELFNAIGPYEEKSNCKIILSSTPNRPDGLMQKIESDVNSKYTKLKLDYTHGLDKIYDRAFIEKKKLDPEFPREYECLYLGKIGNVFTPLQLDKCINLGLEFSTDKIPVSQYTLKGIGVDFGFSSSSTAIVALEHIKTDRDIIRVINSHIIDKGDPNAIVDLCWDIWKQHGFMNTIFFIDGANRAMVNLLKIRWDESLYWETNDASPELMKIIPVNFNTEHKTMLSNLHAVVSKGYLAIDPKYDKLLISLRTAFANELSLDKDQTSYNDLFDALRLSLKAYNIE